MPALPLPAMATPAIAGVALAAALAWTAPAAAGTIVEDVAFSGSVADGVTFVTGPLFNPALGTLTGVRATVLGQYDLSVFTTEGGLPPLIQFALQGAFLTPGADATLSLGTFNGTSTNGTNYTGMASLDYTETISAISAYVAGSPDATNFLAGLGFDAFPTNHMGLGGNADDNSTWAGTLAIAYTYDVPEPGSLMILGLGAALAMRFRRQEKAFFLEKTKQKTFA